MNKTENSVGVAAEQLTALPEVAKSFFTHCKKCEADRYHTVLAHKTATTASVQCEVCKAKSTFKLAKKGKAAKAPSATGGVKVLTGAAAKRKADSQTKAKTAHTNEYNTLAEAVVGELVSYNMKTKFSKHSKMQHPKFGLGYIRMALGDKIEVVFEDEVRLLVHNRS
jgi:hypothetical protein